MITAPNSAQTQTSLLHLNKTNRSLNTTLERLASGKRINAAKDDPAGLIAAKRLEAAIAALEAESRAVQRAGANANITDGHTAQLSSMLSELNGKIVAASNTAGLSDAEIEAHQIEIDSLVSSIQRFSGDAVESLDGFKLPDDGNQALADSLNAAAASLSSISSSGENRLTSGNFEAAQTTIKNALTAANQARGTIGAFQKYTLDSRLHSIAIERENLLESKSRIEDADFAQEASNLSRDRIRQAFGIEVLRIAQQNQSQVLRLLQ